jgi:hypothetical protein
VCQARRAAKVGLRPVNQMLGPRQGHGAAQDTRPFWVEQRPRLAYFAYIGIGPLGIPRRESDVCLVQSTVLLDRQSDGIQQEADQCDTLPGDASPAGAGCIAVFR